ncbi:MAG: sugar-binding transcriptional regulator [Rhodospirillales bacterium]
MAKQKKNGASGTRPAAVDPALAARICWYHFREGQTQQEVADRVGLNRATVNRVINDARREGAVRVTLDLPLAPCLEAENALRETFGLRDAVVVPAPADEDDVRRVVGLAAGQYLSGVLAPDGFLGLGWGATIHAAGFSLIPREGAANTVVSLSGGLSQSGAINPYDNAAAFARVLGAGCYYMTAPMIAETAAARATFAESEPVRRIYDISGRCQAALISAVDLSAKTKMVDYGVLTRDQVADLKDAGAVGNICDYFIGADGRMIDHEINARTLSVPFETLRRIPNVILAAGGTFKAEIVRAALAAGLANTLITDENCAAVLLQG